METHILASIAITSSCGSVCAVAARCGERLDSGPSAEPTDTRFGAGVLSRFRIRLASHGMERAVCGRLGLR